MEDAFLKPGEAFEPTAAVTLSLESLIVNFKKGERSLDKFGDWRSAFNMENGESGLRRSVALR